MGNAVGHDPFKATMVPECRGSGSMETQVWKGFRAIWPQVANGP